MKYIDSAYGQSKCMDHWQFFVELRKPPRIFKETSQHLPSALITLEVICVAKNTIRVLEIEVFAGLFFSFWNNKKCHQQSFIKNFLHQP